jgi:hypothetical protein
LSGLGGVGVGCGKGRTVRRSPGKKPAPANTNLVVRTALEPDRAERAAVAAWRRSQLVEAGFPERLAAALAAERVDVHALIELVERGCRPQLAARIAAPLDWEGP